MTEPLTSPILTIDLAALRRNYQTLCAAAPRADVAGIVKANAYGIGVDDALQVLEGENCPIYFTATLAEAIVVRPLTTQAVAVLGGPVSPDELPVYRAQQITPVLNTVDQIEWAARAAFAGPAIIHIDTGMNRLGLGGGDLQYLLAHAELLQPLDIAYVMSHFACADEIGSPMTEVQAAMFDAAYKKICAATGRTLRASLANSSGIFRSNAYHYDMVRPGMALYGLNPTPWTDNPMAAVVTLSARVLQIREAGAGETVGYGASHTLRRASTRIATIGIGYADGFLRHFSNRGTVYWHDTPCPIIGRVSMDLVTVDITDLPAHIPAPRIGDAFGIINAHQTADMLAEQAGTIGYEILTSLSRRAVRHRTGI